MRYASVFPFLVEVPYAEKNSNKKAGCASKVFPSTVITILPVCEIRAKAR